MKYGWYSAEDNNLGNKQASVFGDSKFALDRRASFIREVVQNSLDVRVKTPVKINISIDKIQKDKIPGIEDLIKRIESCLEKANVDGKREYESALRLLKQEHIYCLKISDSNTKGVIADLDENGESAWRALVYDVGNSYGKSRQGAAGSHGVGKKATFIISEANTVFYSTKYKSINGQDVCLFEGKHMLSTWYDDDTKMCGDGWYGVVDPTLPVEERVIAMTLDECKKNNIAPYFLRTEEYGTDVIALAINCEGNEEEFKKHYINEVLENFYVAIIDENMEVDVLGEYINAQTIDDVFNKYYERERSAVLAGTNKSLLVGNLYDCKRVYKNIVPIKIPIVIDDDEVGWVNLHFESNNEKGKKYYSIVRTHGMKIKDEKVDSEHEFTAVAKIEGDKLNNLLLMLENAAHDDFAVRDNTGIKYDEKALEALKQIKNKVEEYIKERTKIEAQAVQKIKGLEALLNLPGKLSTVKLTKQEVVVVKTPRVPVPRPAQPAGSQYHLFHEFKKLPVVINSDKGYDFLFTTHRNLSKGMMKIMVVDFEGKPNKYATRLLEPMVVLMDGTVLNNNEEGFVFDKMEGCLEHRVQVQTKNKIAYNLGIYIYEYSEGGTNE